MNAFRKPRFWFRSLWQRREVKRWLEDLIQDIRYGTRVLRRNPGFTAVVALTLALGIGANTAVFSVVNAVLLRPLPYAHPEQLVQVRKDFRWVGQSKNQVTDWLDAAEIAAFRRDGLPGVQVAGYAWGLVSLSGSGEAERVSGGAVSDSFLPLLGTSMLVGRHFLPEEDRPGGPAVAILSHGLWTHRFGADPGIVGKTIRLDARSHTVVGVLPPAFQFLERFELYVPLSPHVDGWKEGLFLPKVIARLGPGVSREQARANLDGIYQVAHHPRQQGRILVTGFQEHTVAKARHNLLVFLGATLCVLLIACTNVANLLLSRATGRQKEMALRGALGAGRLRIVRQLLVESVLLSLLGGVLGLVIAAWGCYLLRPVVANLPALRPVRIDGWVLAYTLMAATLTGLLFGLAPALVATRPHLNESLKEGSQALSGGRPHHRLRAALVVTEMALAMVLLLGAGLLTRSFLGLLGVDPGFRPDRILSLSLHLSRAKYPDAVTQTAYHEEVLKRVRSVPGVVAVGANASLPLGNIGMSSDVEIEGHRPPGDGRATVSCGIVNDEYFRALGIPLRRGRWLTDQDRQGAPLVVIVSESFVRQFLPHEEPLGKRLQGGMGKGDWKTIVGVVGDIKNAGLEKKSMPEMFESYLQAGTAHMSLAVRTADNPMKLAEAVRRRVTSVDPDQPIYDMMTMEQRFANVLAPRRITLTLLGVFSGLALVLTAVGIYGVIAYTVAQRTHEIGIRMALGGQRADILQLILKHGLGMAFLGIAAGLAGGMGLTRLLSSHLFGITATDPLTFAGVGLLLCMVALVACLLPAWRATQVDPLAALRCE